MLGLIFPGQGSQYVGMGKVFYENFKVVQHTFEEGSEALKVDLKKLLFDGPDSDLKLTHNTQPAILLVSVALDRILKDVIKDHKKSAPATLLANILHLFPMAFLISLKQSKQFVLAVS